jgi:hypothetical protein
LSQHGQAEDRGEGERAAELHRVVVDLVPEHLLRLLDPVGDGVLVDERSFATRVALPPETSIASPVSRSRSAASLAEPSGPSWAATKARARGRSLASSETSSTRA